MTDNINLWLHLVAFSALYFDNIVWIFCLIVGWQVLQVRPRKATPGVRRIPETHFQLGRNPQQRRRRPAVQQRFHLLLQVHQNLPPTRTLSEATPNHPTESDIWCTKTRILWTCHVQNSYPEIVIWNSFTFVMLDNSLLSNFKLTQPQTLIISSFARTRWDTF